MKPTILVLAVMIMLMPLLSGQETTGAMAAVNFIAPDIAGNNVELDAYKNKVVLLDFWATWCGPCRREIPNLIDIKDAFKDAPFEIISVALERGSDDFARQFVKDQKMNWVHIMDLSAGRQIAEKYQIRYIPSMFLIKNGKILASDLRGEELKEKIKQLVIK
ncbi:MAG: TlpA disulfide reductase family protein [Candidatus Aminicenantes bacterium]|nr:TlpA disulfide reductase family protein [Candidatus Aminicenantes bacterium]